MFFGLNRF